MNIWNMIWRVMKMAKYEGEACGGQGKPLFMEPATRLCPKCRGIKVKKMKS